MTRAGLRATLLHWQEEVEYLFPEMLEALGEPKSHTECTSFMAIPTSEYEIIMSNDLTAHESSMLLLCQFQNGQTTKSMSS